VLYVLPEFLRTPLAFVIVLSVLIFFHELGHYLVARWCGVHVEVFSIGFGKTLWSRVDRVGTVWRIAVLPLGGYVKMHGQEQPTDVSEEERAKWREHQTFHHKSVGKRAMVVAAGPVANFLLAIVLFACLLAVNGRPTRLQPVLGTVVANSAAERAGLRTDDRVIAIDGNPIEAFGDIQRHVSPNPGKTITLTVERAGARQDISAVIDRRGTGDSAIGVLGVSGSKYDYESVGVVDAVIGGFSQSWQVTTETLAGLWQMINGSRGAADLGGPLRIAQLSGQVAQYGFVSLVSFMAVISINLGLINLFPIPVLDGGHLLFYAAEAIRGRPLPPVAVEYGMRAGVALIGMLFVFATWNDISHLGIVRWVVGLIGS
jgi:regulator of sigma E protease